MTKSLHAGRTAQAGVLAARLAKAGFTGSPDIFEHPSGFMHAHSPSGHLNLAAADWQLGRRWRMAELGVNIKRYPMCYATHRSIDAMLDLVVDHELTPDVVDSIQVRIGDTQQLMLRNHDPNTALEAKFSIEFAIASALIARRVSLKELDDDFVCSSEVKQAMRKVHASTTDEKMADMPFAPDDRVSVSLKSGKTLVHEPVVYPKGSWKKPLLEAELKEKFLDCAGIAMPTKHAEALVERLASLEKLENLRELPVGSKSLCFPEMSSAGFKKCPSI
jgi:2-methylcitrate dehydratase PrpD